MASSLYDQYQKLGELKSLTIAFFDLVDSTYLKKQLGQSRGVDLAVTHNKTAAGICQLFGGRIVKHIGDSIMVVFDTPLECMLAALEFIGKIHSEKLPFQTKAGLTHGTVTRVEIQGADYLGQAVDRSARLTAQALPNQIITDETTMDIIKPFLEDFQQIISRFLGVQELKGLGKIPVYEVALSDTGFVDATPIIDVRLGSADPVKEQISKVPPDVRLQLPPLSVPQTPDSRIVDPPLGIMLESCALTQDVVDMVALGYQNLSHILEKAHNLYIRQISLSGAFSRGTMIRPLETVDVIAVMTPPAREEQQGVAETLKMLADYLSGGYPGSAEVHSEHRVNVNLNGVGFAVIPVLAVIDKGRGQLMMPSRMGGFWLARNPAAPEKWMEQAIERNGQDFLPFLRLIKAWQRTHNAHINSFHLEMLTDLIASKASLDLSFDSFYQWFLYAYQYFCQNKKPFIKETGQGGIYIDDYMYSNPATFNRFSRVLTDSYSLAKQGMAYHRAGEVKTAMARWKTLFGEYLT